MRFNFIKINKSNKRFFYFLLLLNSLLYGQSLTAEKLFKQYWRVGISGGIDIHGSVNEKNAYNFKLDDIRMFYYGVNWNFYQKQNHNISVGLYRFGFSSTSSYWLSNDITDLGYDSGSKETVIIPSFIEWVKIPLLYEYYFHLKKENNFISLGAGLELMTFNDYEGSGEVGLQNLETGESLTLFSYDESSDRSFNLGLKLKAGFLVTSNIGLFEFAAHALLSPNHLINYRLEINDMVNSTVTIQNPYIRGSYFGFGINYYFKRKKKRNEKI